MKKQICIILCLVFSIIFGGCNSAEQVENTEKFICYVNTEGNTIEKQEYQSSETDYEKEVRAMLKALKESPESIELKSAIPQEVKITGVRFKNSQLEVHFNEQYLKMPKSTEVLCRAAVVQTLVQVHGVSFVSFYVGEEPLKDKQGNPIGLMRAEDFVQNTGTSINSYQTTELTLYFANKEGTALNTVKKNNVHYNANTSIEKLVVEQLMKGPSDGKTNPTIPKVTKLIGVSVKDGVCYVNFDGSFLTERYNQKAEVPIYSIVNSIIENGSASRVQILVDGASDISLNSIKLNRPLEWNADLIEEKKN